MRKLIGVFLLLSACDSYEEVLVDGKYDVRVVLSEAPNAYSVVHNLVYTDVRPSDNKAVGVYTKAIEEVSGCTVSAQNITWSGTLDTPRLIMKAYPDC